MKRWFAARMGDFENDGSSVPKVNLYQCDSRIWSVAGRAWCIGQLGTNKLGRLQADPDIILFPDATLDLEWRTVGNGIRAQFAAAITAAGFDASSIAQGATVRDVIAMFVHQIMPGINIEDGDVVDQVE